MSILEHIAEGAVGVADVAEMAMGHVPMVGTAYHGIQSVYNATQAGLDIATGGSGDDAADHATAAAVHAVEAIPYAGTVLGLGHMAHDLLTDGPTVNDQAQDVFFPGPEPGIPSSSPSQVSPADQPRYSGTRDRQEREDELNRAKMFGSDEEVAEAQRRLDQLR